MFSIDGYTRNFISREDRRGGGVGIYIKNKHNCKVFFMLCPNVQTCKIKTALKAS